MRSLLFAGAGRADLIAKLPRSRPGGAVVDLEDAVPPAAKHGARAALAGLVAGLRETAPEQDVYVRVNAVASPWFEADIAALPFGIAGVVVPKVEEPDELARVATALGEIGLGDAAIVAGVESARGALNVEAILAGTGEVPPPYAAYFGAEDLIADLGGERTPGGEEVLYARSRFVLAARVAGVLAIDQAVVDLRDGGRFAADARTGRRLGYRGKICIHPDQVKIANQVFGPDAVAVERARRMLAAADKAAAEGIGALEFEGEMVDGPALKLAREVLKG